jgi:hypothetical protein
MKLQLPEGYKLIRLGFMRWTFEFKNYRGTFPTWTRRGAIEYANGFNTLLKEYDESLSTPAEGGGEVMRIKPLLWHFRSTDVNEVWSSSVMDSCYEIRRFRYGLSPSGDWSDWIVMVEFHDASRHISCNSLDHGKELAQADWESRLSEYLEEQP